MRTIVIAGLVAGLLTGCDDTSPAVVGPWQVPVADTPPPVRRLCLVMTDDEFAGTVCNNLLDFEFEWGVEQHIRYRELDAEDALQKCQPFGNNCRQVVEVEERVRLPPGSTTTLPFPPSPVPWFAVRDATSVTMVDTPVRCDALCDQLVTTGSGGGVFEVDVALTGDPTVPLQATAVRSQ